MRARLLFSNPTILFLIAMLLGGAVGLRADDSSQAKPKPGEPTSAKARKTWDTALDWQKKGHENIAIDELRQANEEDGGHCTECLRRAYAMALMIGEYKDAAEIAHDWLVMAQTDAERAVIHAKVGEALRMQAIAYKKKQLLQQSCDEYKAALALDAHAPLIQFGYGVSLASLRQDDAARAEFTTFLAEDKDNLGLERRAQRFLEHIDLARQPLAPDFKLTAFDGQQVSRDSLAGKVVLIDFWATWCAPCREAIPKIADLVQKFSNTPFVVISVDLDKDKDDWLLFVHRNRMTWLQYSDSDFNGPMARAFGVNAIPATFIIDADGILEDQRVGDTDIEAKLKKLIASAEKIQTH
jgi:thiol-disulfide isomerase/thioredoxin